MRKQLYLLPLLLITVFANAQNVGIGTTTPQSTLDVKGNQRIGGVTSYMAYDTLSGKIDWRNANLFVPVSQRLIQHSAAADGLFYNNTAPITGQLEYRNATGNPVFYTNFINGNGYFAGNVGIGAVTPQAKLHIISTGNEVARLDAGEPYLSLYSNGVYKGYFWKSPNSIEIGSASGSSLPITLAPDGYQRMFVTPAGNVGIGTGSPLARLHVPDSSVLFSAAGDVPATPGTTPISGAGRRMMWYPDKAAFRAGYVFADNWDKDNVGDYSIAMGFDTKASGDYSTAMGGGTIASGSASTAMGNYNIASGMNSTVMGGSTVASGDYSTAMGGSTNASGDFSTAMGYYTNAFGYYSTAMGVSTNAGGWYSTAMGHFTDASSSFSTAMGSLTNASGDYSTAMGQVTNAKAVGSLSAGIYNDDTDSPNPTTAAPTDRIFQIGNGTSSTRSNAITVLRNGNTGIGTVNPGTRLHIVQGFSGHTGGNFPGFALEGNANVYMNMLSPNGNETGLLFGKASDPASGGIVYNSAAHLNGMEFRTNGNATKMVLLDNGNLGIGVSDPAFRLDVGERMRIRSTAGNSAGIWLNNDFNNVSPAFIGMKSNDEVGFYGQTGVAGWRFYVNTTTGNGWMQGTLTQASDARLKKDISRLQNPLQKIVQLNGYTYRWKNEQLDNNLQTGVMAQEVQKLFPELVKEDKEGMLSVNYSGLIPVMIESIKEQQQQINALLVHDKEQQKQIDDLKKMVEKFLKQ